MLAVIIATILSRSLLDNESIYTLKLTRRGIRLQSGRDVDVLQAVTVEEAMTRDVDTVPTDMTLVELSEAFGQSRHHGFAVLNEQGQLWGIVTISDLESALARNAPRSTPVTDIGTGNADLLIAYPDETMDVVLSRMGTRGLGRLPVVARSQDRHLLGMIRREDIISAYRTALTRRAELQHRAKRMRLRNIDDTEFLEIPLTEPCVAVGQSLAEVAGQLPDECIVISIRRNGRVLIPHGDTVFKAEDRVTAFVRSSAARKLYDCLLGPDMPGVIR
jgi:CIC family chloride channel protein